MSITPLLKIAACVALSVMTCSAFAWRINMNFDNGALGVKAQSTSTTLSGSALNGVFNDAAGATYFTNAISYEGGRAAELNITQGCTCFGTWGGIINYPSQLKKGDQIWFRVRTYMPVGFNYDSSGEGNHLKFMRIHTQDTAGNNQGYNDWYINPKGSSIAHQFIFEGEQVWNYFGSSQYAPVLGVWETYEFYVKFDNVPVSKGGMGEVRVWKNGVLLADITDRMTLATASSVSDRAHLFTYWNGGSPATQKMYVDDIVLTSDKPTAIDSKGNPYVGMALASSGSDAPASDSPPSPPTLQVR
jgi:hypothetical protein